MSPFINMYLQFHEACTLIGHTVMAKVEGDFSDDDESDDESYLDDQPETLIECSIVDIKPLRKGVYSVSLMPDCVGVYECCMRNGDQYMISWGSPTHELDLFTETSNEKPRRCKNQRRSFLGPRATRQDHEAIEEAYADPQIAFLAGSSARVLRNRAIQM